MVRRNVITYAANWALLFVPIGILRTTTEEFFGIIVISSLYSIQRKNKQELLCQILNILLLTQNESALKEISNCIIKIALEGPKNGISTLRDERDSYWVLRKFGGKLKILQCKSNASLVFPKLPRVTRTPSSTLILVDRTKRVLCAILYERYEIKKMVAQLSQI